MEHQWNDNISQGVGTLVSKCPRETWPVAAGIASFGSTLALSTWTQLTLLGVSTGTRPRIIPSSLGAASVCLASIASHHMAVVVHGEMESFKRRRKIAPSSAPSIVSLLPDNVLQKLKDNDFFDLKHSFPSNHCDKLNLFGIIQVPMQTIRICVVGLLAFQLLGGRFWAIAPSSYTSIGSFARRGIPATDKYASTAQKVVLQRYGRRFGCHTCGSKKAPFVGDHMPPKSVALEWNARWYNRLLNRKVPFRFYPQCTPCSNKQGSLLSTATKQQPNNPRGLVNAGGGKMACHHGWRPRWNHWAGGVVAGVTVVGATDDDIQTGNIKRFRKIEYKARDWLYRICWRIG